MKDKKSSNKKTKIRPKFIVEREYSGKRTMKEAFEEVITEQASSHFDKWCAIPGKMDTKKLQKTK